MRTLVAFDCYGTLVDFDLDRVVRGILAERLRIDGVDEAEFLHDFRVMRFQPEANPWRPRAPRGSCRLSERITA